VRASNELPTKHISVLVTKKDRTTRRDHTARRFQQEAATHDGGIELLGDRSGRGILHDPTPRAIGPIRFQIGQRNGVRTCAEPHHFILAFAASVARSEWIARIH
jgi:hypothetical protein